jgi:DNA (cytosine-5)-methyltransferase 1
MEVVRFRLGDVFAGCGGMTRGFLDSGRFFPAFAIEADPDAAETYRANFGSHVVESRIQHVHDVPLVDVLVGGPPCQGFSTLNRNGVGLDRRALWRYYVRSLDASGAVAFVMENVPQLLRSPEYVAFAAAARDRGFVLHGRVLHAADYGVPQLRRRAIVIGIRGAEPHWPEPTHHRPDSVPLDGESWRTFRDAISQPTPLSLVPDGLRWHRARNPRPLSIERYRTIPYEGEGRFELAARRPEITPRCWLQKKTGTTDVFGRLWWDRPCSTIRTEFYKPEKGRYLHPSEHRPITVREAARCMSFPDDFELLEHQSMTSVARQVGNAVPPLLAQRIAESVAVQLDLVQAGHTSVAAYRSNRRAQRAAKLTG